MDAEKTLVHARNQLAPLIPVKEGLWIYKVPNQVYQMFFDMIPQQGIEGVEYTKHRILRELKSFISDKFPGYVIVNLEELTREQAQKIHPSLEYGMYVQLAEGVYDGTIGIEDSLKQIEYGK